MDRLMDNRLAGAEPTHSLSRAEALKRLKAGRSRGVDISGSPPRAVINALLQGAEPDVEAAVLTHDDDLPRLLNDHGARVWVALPPDRSDTWTLVAHLEGGGTLRMSGDANKEACDWSEDGFRDRVIHKFNVGGWPGFPAYDGKGVASSLAVLTPEQRTKLERRLAKVPEVSASQVQRIQNMRLALVALSFLLSVAGFTWMGWNETVKLCWGRVGDASLPALFKHQHP